MTKRRAAVLLLVMFFVGAVCGAAGTAAWVRSRGVGALGQNRAEQAAIRRIARRLDLDDEQRKVLQSIASETRGRMDVFREEAMQRVDEILDRAVEELLPTLRDDQKAKLMQMREETRRRFHRHQHGRHRGHDGGSRRDSPGFPRQDHSDPERRRAPE